MYKITQKMKKIKTWVIMVAVSLTTTATITSCAGINSLSDEEAYELGYALGKTAGYYLNN